MFEFTCIFPVSYTHLDVYKRQHLDPSLNRSIGYLTKLTDQMNDQTITIIQNHYLKNIREELLEEKSTIIDHSDNEIAYIIAKINGIPNKFIVDTGANVSLIDSIV